MHRHFFCIFLTIYAYFTGCLFYRAIQAAPWPVGRVRAGPGTALPYHSRMMDCACTVLVTQSLRASARWGVHVHAKYAITYTCTYSVFYAFFSANFLNMYAVLQYAYFCIFSYAYFLYSACFACRRLCVAYFIHIFAYNCNLTAFFGYMLHIAAYYVHVTTYLLC